MALFPYYRYRFFGDPFFFNELDFFDPWFDFDVFPTFVPITSQSGRFRREERLTRSTTRTINNGQSFEQQQPLPPTPPPEKFRVQLNVDGFNPDAINKRIEGRKLIIEGKQEDRQDERNYTSRQLRGTYDLPGHADPNGLTSYVAPDNKLVVEVPYRNLQDERRLEQVKNGDQSLVSSNQYRSSSFDNVGSIEESALQPRILDRGNNQKQLELTVGVNNYRPEELKVSVQNNELIVQGEHQYKDQNRSERSYFFKSTTLPRGTQVDQLQSHYNDGGQLKIEGPIL